MPKEIFGAPGRIAGVCMPMTPRSVLGSCPAIAFVCATNPGSAKAFYGDVLGLRLLRDESPFALVFDACGTMLRISFVQELKPAVHTVLGWQVPDVMAAVRDLAGAGIQMRRFGGLTSQDDLGVWSSPSGAKIAWFNDPDGNLLSITQF
jgi:catechol 2,3-dioxygenase-like lactoylglutathione lyase family enzyme